MSMLWELSALKQMAKQPTVPGVSLNTALQEIDRLINALGGMTADRDSEMAWAGTYQREAEKLEEELDQVRKAWQVEHTERVKLEAQNAFMEAEMLYCRTNHQGF
jgi:hypothetical protein